MSGNDWHLSTQVCTVISTLLAVFSCPRAAHAQVVESTGLVMSPYLEYPQLLSVLLRMLNEGEGSQHVRREVLKVLGIIGALDPHTHKTNQADLQGEGKLEREGVRPQRQQPPVGALPGETLGAPVLAAGANVFRLGHPSSSVVLWQAPFATLHHEYSHGASAGGGCRRAGRGG